MLEADFKLPIDFLTFSKNFSPDMNRIIMYALFYFLFVKERENCSYDKERHSDELCSSTLSLSNIMYIYKCGWMKYSASMEYEPP